MQQFRKKTIGRSDRRRCRTRRLAEEHEIFGTLPDGRDVDGVREAPILRLTGAMAEPLPEPDWPRLSVARAEELVESMRKRVGAVSGRAVRDTWTGQFGKLASGALWSAVGSRKLKEWLTRTVASELIRRDQIEELAGHSAEERLVLASLFGPGPDLRTIPGLAAQAGLEESQVRSALATLEKPSHERFRIWKGPVTEGAETWTIEAYRPPAITRTPVIGRAYTWFLGNVSRG